MRKLRRNLGGAESAKPHKGHNFNPGYIKTGGKTPEQFRAELRRLQAHVRATAGMEKVAPYAGPAFHLVVADGAALWREVPPGHTISLALKAGVLFPQPDGPKWVQEIKPDLPRGPNRDARYFLGVALDGKERHVEVTKLVDFEAIGHTPPPAEEG
jgi:hypothetical protein